MNTSDSVTITVNGQPHALAEGASLADVIAAFGYAPEAVATAVNGVFVARGSRIECSVKPGDQVTCFKPITGG